MQANLYRLSEEWKEIDTIILYGAGIVFKICQNLFEKVNIKISFIIDRDVNKQGTSWNGIPIISYEDAKNKIENQKIVIMTAHTAYNEIIDLLEKQGKKNTKISVRLANLFVNGFGKQKE